MQNHCKESHKVLKLKSQKWWRGINISLSFKMNLSNKNVDWSQPRWGYSKALLSWENQVSVTAKSCQTTISSNVKLIKVDKTPNTTLYTTPVTQTNTPSKPIIHNILTKRPLSDTEKANVKRIWKDVVTFIFHDEIDDSQLLTAEINSTWTLLWTNSMLHNICYVHSCNHIWWLCSVVLF